MNSKQSSKKLLRRKSIILNNRASRAFFDKICDFRTEYKVDRTALEEVSLPDANILGQFQAGKPHGYCEVYYKDGSIFK
jgi:hypothetical protein